MAGLASAGIVHLLKTGHLGYLALMPAGSIGKWMRQLLLACHGWWSAMSGAISIPFALIALFSSGHQRWLFVALAFVSLWVFVAAVIKKNLALQEKIRPKLKISCGKNVFGSVTESIVDLADRGNIPFPTLIRFYRMAVESDGVDAVHDCRALLTQISKNGVKRWGDDNVLLTFAPGEDADATCKTIYDKTTEFLDVLLISEWNKIIPAVKNRHWRFTPTERIFSEPGEYILTVVISAQGMATIKVLLTFNWTGVSETAELSLLGTS
jgi:hypothetical protein